MKDEQEIKEKIEEIEEAKKDYVQDYMHTLRFNERIKTLEWVLGYKYSDELNDDEEESI